MHPILQELAEDSTFPDFRTTLNLNDAAFKSMKLAEKKTVILPLITDAILEKYFFMNGTSAMEDENVEDDDIVAD